MYQYLNLLEHIIAKGNDRSDRTGTGTRSVFGYQMRFDLSKGFPLLTTKEIFFRSVIHELLWFLRGDTNLEYLRENNVKIWEPWADKHGNVGRIYGAQWRDWKTAQGESIDQISRLIQGLKENPYSRRHLVIAFNPGELEDVYLPPCHVLFQFYVENQRLSCQLYQRSADVFLGVPFNIASYALLTSMIGHELGLVPHEFIHTFGDVHLYHNHMDQAKLQLLRTPYPCPTLELNPKVTKVFDFTFDDITLKNYRFHPHIKAPISV
ncbi:MAG: thymidylate synthase [Proteobacteria bacterium]|nr:thymidylate synthase [Pseudomonadota bacterium]